jgi:hypothetical protein
MKLVNYQLQNQIEHLSEQKSNSYFKEYLQSVLEDESKPYYQKADYVGLSLNELKNKIDDISTSIKELQAYKKRLSSALDIAKTITAKVLLDNGVDRIDGNIISSITLSKPLSKTKTDISILDEQEIMKMGYIKFSVDMEAIDTKSNTEVINKALNKSTGALAISSPEVTPINNIS